MIFRAASRSTSVLLAAAGLALYALGACQADALVDPRAEMELATGFNDINNAAAVAVSGDFVSFEQRVGGETVADTSARSHLELNWKELSYGRTELTLDGVRAEGTWLRGNYRIVDTGTTLIFYNADSGGGHAPRGRVASLRMELNATHDTLQLRGSFDDCPLRMNMVRFQSLR